MELKEIKLKKVRITVNETGEIIGSGGFDIGPNAKGEFNVVIEDRNNNVLNTGIYDAETIRKRMKDKKWHY